MASYGTAVYPSQPTTTTFAGSYPGTQAVPGATEFTGDALTPENNLYPGSSTYAGQGLLPILQVLYSFDDASDPTPSWSYVADADVRSFSVSRGRESELQEFDAGSATIVVDNRDRAFDPAVNSSVRPMNRWWLREQFSGETHDLFMGYAESYNQQWPDGGWSNAIVEVAAVDEFKVLALDALPTTSPPRDSYADVVASDLPTGYYNMNLAGRQRIAQGNPGAALKWIGGTTGTDASPIIGDPDYVTSALQIGSGGSWQSDDLNPGDAWDATGLSEFTVEGWFYVPDATATGYWLLGPTQSSGVVSPAEQYGIAYGKDLGFADSDRDLLAWFVGSAAGGTLYAMKAVAVLQSAAWHHVALVTDGSFARLYLNGTQRVSAAFSGTIAAMGGAGQHIQLGNASSTVATNYAELAFYRYGLAASRIAAHFQAGRNRGFAQQASGTRVGAVLDAAMSAAPRNIQTGARTVQARYMRGQPPLDSTRESVAAEAVDAGLFAGAGGNLVYLDSNHRNSAPYNTAQATFGDAGGAELPYADVAEVPLSDAFITNEWNVTRDGSQVDTQTASDATSIGRYFKRSQSLSGLALTSDADAATVAAAMLAKYKDPMERIAGLSLTTAVPEVSEAIFRRELMDRIRVLRTPPGGGARKDQTSYIQKIEISGADDGAPWQIRWGISPL